MHSGRWTVNVSGMEALFLLAAPLALGGGVGLLCCARLGMHRLPGDVVVRRKNATFYFPLGLALAVSVLLTVLLSAYSLR
jgi:Protein of unknown function (DUF2905)